MDYEVGEKLTQYSIRNNVLHIKEGIIKEVDTRWFPKRFVFVGGQKYPPNTNRIGVVTPAGPSVWLRGRDDELAKKLLREYEETKIKELEKSLEKRKKLLELLK